MGRQAGPASRQRALAYRDGVEIPPEQRNALGEDVAKMLDWLDQAGYSVDIEAQRREYPEIDWHRYAEWAKARDWSAINEPIQH